jgi:hypothetical protein
MGECWKSIIDRPGPTLKHQLKCIAETCERPSEETATMTNSNVYELDIATATTAVKLTLTVINSIDEFLGGAKG